MTENNQIHKEVSTLYVCSSFNSVVQHVESSRRLQAGTTDGSLNSLVRVEEECGELKIGVLVSVTNCAPSILEIENGPPSRREQCSMNLEKEGWSDKYDKLHLVEEAKDSCDLAHEVTSTFPVQAAFILHRRNPLSDVDGNRLFALLDLQESRKLTLDEVERIVNKNYSSETHDLIWKFKDTPLAHLASKKSLKMLFDKIDPDHGGGITIQQWRAFLAELMVHDHNYLRRKGLSTYRAFFGLGRGPQLADMTIQSSATDPLFGFIDRAWLADFWYYEKNHHPLFALFLADADHPLKRRDVLKIEFFITSWNLFASTIVYQLSGSTGLLYFLSFVIVTIPLVIMRNILLFLFTCPCMQIRNKHPGCCQRKCVGCCQRTGRCTGNWYAAGGAAFLVLGILTAMKFGLGFVDSWLFSWGASYAVCVFLDLATRFNCMSVCLSLRESRWNCLCLGLPKRIQLCQWLVEKNIVLRAMKGGETFGKSDDRNAGGGSSRSYKYIAYKVTQVLPV